METFDERLDEAFETHLRGVPFAGLVWMEEEVAWEMRRARARPEGPHPGEAKVLPSSAAAERTLVRHLVRNAIREVWEGRIKAVDREAALVAADAAPERTRRDILKHGRAAAAALGAMSVGHNGRQGGRLPAICREDAIDTG